MPLIIIPTDDISDELTEFSTFAELQSTAEAIAGRSLVAGAKSLLIGDLNARLRVRQMYSTYTPEGAELPFDFLEMDVLEVDGCVYSPTTDSNRAPNGYTIQDSEITLGDNEGGVISMRYYRKIGASGNIADEPAMTAYPLVFLYGILWHHGRLARDESAQAWGAAFSEALDSAIMSDQNSRMSSVAMTPQPKTYI